MPTTTDLDESIIATRLSAQEALGLQIKRLREEQDMSQTDLGLALARYQPDHQPVPQTTISRWEVGQAALTFWQITDLERALGVAQGTLIKAAGLTPPTTLEAEDDERLLYEVIRTSSAIDSEIRPDVQAAIQAFIKTSKRLRKQRDSLDRLR